MRKISMSYRVLFCLLGIQALFLAQAGAQSLTAHSPVQLSPRTLIVGTVTGTDGKPLQDVSVMVKGAKKGTFTNSSGAFAINAKSGDVLVFSSIGFKQQEVTVGNETTINVTLVSSNTQMTEVVVTALGIKKQARSLGYSTT
ncbi:MAG: carboxypeptidase-like regulatory domain-containing protein, partial [Bacteroidota bacterium]|nr:carboxypeptidase-like regulatory domain-containing protein [Bacteroidota bacterium]